MNLNKAIIVGNLIKDPEIRALPSGGNVTSFTVATNRVWKDASGEKKEGVDFHNIVVFGKQAESCAQYLKKGSSALIDGRMQTRSWETDGVKKYRTEIVADNVQFGSRSEQKPKVDEGEVREEEIDPVTSKMEDGTTINVDDIPF